MIFWTNIRKWKNRTYRADAWDRLYRQRRNLCQSVVYLAGCERSLCEENNGSLTEEIQQTCNVQVASGYGIVTHIYNLRHHLIPDTAVSFCTIMDYFGIAADRKKKVMVHASNGASFGFFNVQKNVFMTEELYKMGGRTVASASLHQNRSTGKLQRTNRDHSDRR